MLAACLAIALGVAFANAPQLRVRAVDAAVPPGSPVTQSAVLAAAAIDPTANLWLLDTGAIRRRIEALPYVASAAVHRRQFPQPNVQLTIVLRVPTGCVSMPGGAVTIDATERVLQTGCASGALPLVDAGAGTAVAPGNTLTEPDLNRLLADARTIAAQVPVRIVRRDRFGGLEAVDAHGVLLEFGADADLAAKQSWSSRSAAAPAAVRCGRSTCGRPRPP